MSRLPHDDAEEALARMARRRENTHTFDASRIKQLSERVLFDRPAAQMSPLVREPGRLVVTTGMALTYSLVPF